jgi:hypothetical protein
MECEGQMSDEDDSISFEELGPLLDLERMQLEKHMDGLHFAELFDLQSYFIGQAYLVQDMAFKMNNRKGKLNKRYKKGTVYGVED